MSDFAGPPISQEMKDVTPMVADILLERFKKTEPQYTYGGIGKGLIGGLFNAIGGIFGNDDLGGELFGKRTDNPSELASLLIQMSGMEEDMTLRRESMALQREMAKQQAELTKMLAREQHGHEKEMATISFDQIKEKMRLENEEWFKRSNFGKETQESLLNLQAGIESQRLDKINAADINKILTQATVQDAINANESFRNFAAQAASLTRDAELKKSLMRLDARLQMRRLEQEQKHDAWKTNEQTKTLKQNAKLEANTARATTRMRTQSEERIAGARIASQAASDAATNAQKQAETNKKNAEEALDYRGRMFHALDTAAAFVDKNFEGVGQEFLKAEGDLPIRELVANASVQTEGNLDPEIIDRIREKVKKDAVNAFLADPNADPKTIKEQLFSSYETSFSNSKAAIMDARREDPLIGKEPSIDSRIYGELDTAFAKVKSTMNEQLPAVVAEAAHMNRVRQGIGSAYELLNSSDFFRLAGVWQRGNNATGASQSGEELRSSLIKELDRFKTVDPGFDMDQWSQQVGHQTDSIAKVFEKHRQSATNPEQYDKARNALLQVISGATPSPLRDVITGRR